MRSEPEARDLIRLQAGRWRPDLDGLEVSFTSNSSTMVSRTQRGSQAVLRLHRIFLDAPEELLGAIVRSFLARLDRRTNRAIRSRLRDYVQVHRGQILRPVLPGRLLPPAGAVFDLEEILERVSRRHFPADEAVEQVEIGWSRHLLRRLMGKWIENPEPLPNLVLINRLLDTPQVPEYYLEFLVFHELLHEVIPLRRSRGRWIHHPPEFRARERAFPEYRRAMDWEKKNLERLYRRSTRGHCALP